MARTELTDTIMRRILTGNLFGGVVPALFYCLLNGWAYILELVRFFKEVEAYEEVDRHP